MSEAAVWVDRGRQGGEPCIMGTRLPTHVVAGIAWDRGFSVAQSWYPHVTIEQIKGACWYEVAHGDRRRWRRAFRDWPKRWDEKEWKH